MLSNVSSQYLGLYNVAGLAQGSGIYGTLAAYNAGTNASVTSLARQESSYQVKLSAYGQLKSALSSFASLMGDLGSAQNVAPYQATSSNTKIATAVATKDTAEAKSYSVSISQVAKPQVLTGPIEADANSTIIGSGTLYIQIGSYNSGQNVFTPASASAKTITITPTNGTLSGIASAINAVDSGVKASVVQTSAGFQLSLTSTNTGTSNTLRITVSDSNGGNTDTTGLSKLAFDPTAITGQGKNLTETNFAQNAVLTVNGSSFINQSNTTESAIKGVKLDLVDAGTATIDIARSDSSALEAAAKFVDAYNLLQKTASGLTTRTPSTINPPLAYDALSNKIMNEIASITANTTQGFGQDRLDLAAIGITRNNDGSLSLNKETLQQSFVDNPEGVVSLITGLSQKLQNNVAEDTGINSQLQFTSRSIERSLNNISQRKTLLNNYSYSSYFGMHETQQFSDQIFSGYQTRGTSLYLAVANLI